MLRLFNQKNENPGYSRDTREDSKGSAAEIRVSGKSPLIFVKNYDW